MPIAGRAAGGIVAGMVTPFTLVVHYIRSADPFDGRSALQQRASVDKWLSRDRRFLLVGEYHDTACALHPDALRQPSTLLADAAVSKFDAVVVEDVHRLGRDGQHLLATLKELQRLDVPVFIAR